VGDKSPRITAKVKKQKNDKKTSQPANEPPKAQGSPAPRLV